MSANYASHFVSSANSTSVSELARITEHIHGLLFTEDEKDLQVFLFLDDEKQREIASRLSLPVTNSFEEHLNRLIKQLPASGTVLDVFNVMIGATGRWRASGDFLSPPPALPLLLLFSNAARAMGEGEDVAGHNYYEHLEHRLETGDKPRLEQAYRKWSVELWQSYRDWLAAWQDEIGICTVVFPDDSDTNNRKFVQMAISQAILRSQERENLGKMFNLFNLDSSVPVSDTLMRAMIEEWLTRSHCSPRLKKMWKKKETHQPIIVGASAHLAQWTRDEPGPLRDRISLGLSVQRVPRTGEISLNLDILAKYAPRSPEFEVLDENENWASTPIFEVDSRRFRANGASSFELESLLQEVIEGRLTSRGHTATGTRKPRAVVPLLLQHATREYTESPSIFLNSPFALLIRTDKEARLLPKVLDLLGRCAMPGWKLLSPDQRKNLPPNWEFIEGVQLVRPPAADLLRGLPALGVFEVVATSLVSASGGLRIPGRIPRWLASNPPLLVGSFPDEEIVELLFSDVDSKSAEALLRAPVTDGVVTLNLIEADLKPGLYSVASVTADRKLQVRETIQLVSADTPDVFASLNSRPLASAIGLGNTAGFTSATALSEVQSEPHLRGLAIRNITNRSNSERAAVPRMLPVRAPAKQDGSDSNKIKLAKRAAPACAEGGAHHWLYEREVPGKKKDVYLAECKHCRFIYGFSSRAKPKQVPKLLGSVAAIPRAPVPSAAPPVALPAAIGDEDWNLAYEALCFLQHGDYKTLTAVCSQISPSQLSISEFWKNLVTLGHLEMSFDQNQRAVRWFVTKPVLSVLGDTRGVLAGNRSETMKATLADLLKPAGYEVKIEPCPGFIDYWFVGPSDSNAVNAQLPLSESVPDSIDWLEVETDFASRTIANLASLGVARDGLSKIKMFGTDRKRWDHSSRKWRSIGLDWSQQGSYQTVSFTTSYFFNPSTIPPDGLSLLASYDLVKHLSAHLEGQPLCAYNPETKVLAVPLGADLPRLYARAICGASGMLPTKMSGSELHYYNVSEALAERLYWLLSH
jgi:hypothetical protein